MDRSFHRSPRALFAAIALLSISTFVACNPGESPTSEAAKPGTAGNPCYGNQTCNDDLTCEQGTCRKAESSTTACGELSASDCYFKAVEERTVLARTDRQLQEDKARQMVEAACSSGSGMACHALGENYSSGAPYLALQRTDRDKKRALDYFQKSCEHGFAVGCYAAAIRYADPGSPVPEDAQKYYALMTEGCQKGYPPACLEIGNMQLSGDGIEKNATRGAAVLYETWELTEPDHGSVSFTTLSDENREPLVRDDATMPTGTLLAQYYIGQDDRDRAKTMFRRACHRGEGVACTQAGALQLGEGSSQSDADVKSALLLLEHGCTATGTASSCLVYVMLDGPKDVPANVKEEKQMDFLKRACRDADFACKLLGDRYAKSDIARADQLADKYWGIACRGGIDSACDKTQ